MEGSDIGMQAESVAEVEAEAESVAEVEALAAGNASGHLAVCI